MNHGPLVYIANGLEHEWDFVSTLRNKKLKDKAVRTTHNLADSYLFSNPNCECIFISPIALDKTFVSYAEHVLHSRFTILVPRYVSFSLCDNLRTDTNTFSFLIQTARENDNKLTIKSYTSSTQLMQLIASLRKQGVAVYAPDTPEPSAVHTVTYYGSKSGFRSSFSKYMPEGVVCASQAEALKGARNLYQTHAGVVIKTDRGCTGEGVLIFRKPQPFSEVEIKLKKEFARHPYWSLFPIVVEAYIKPALRDRPFPSIEGHIDELGKLTLPYYCNMIVTSAGEFYGVEIHKDSVAPVVRKKMLVLSRTIGKTYAKAGYRGTFDIDFIYDGKRLYADESNMRTNGGSDTFQTVRALIGKTFFTDRYVVSNFLDFAAHHNYIFSRIKKILEPYLYNNRTKTGVIIGSASAFRLHGLSLIIIALSSRAAVRLQSKIRTLIHGKKNGSMK